MVFHALAFGDVEHDANQPANGAVGLAESGLVEHHVAYLTVGVADLAFIDLEAGPREEFAVRGEILFGQFGRSNVVRPPADQFAP